MELHPTGEVSEYTATIAYELLSEADNDRRKVDSLKFILKADGNVQYLIFFFLLICLQLNHNFLDKDNIFINLSSYTTTVDFKFECFNSKGFNKFCINCTNYHNCNHPLALWRPVQSVAILQTCPITLPPIGFTYYVACFGAFSFLPILFSFHHSVVQQIMDVTVTLVIQLVNNRCRAYRSHSSHEI